MQSSQRDTHLALSSFALSLSLFMSMQALLARCGRWGAEHAIRGACQVIKRMQRTQIGAGIAYIRRNDEMRYVSLTST